MESLHEVENFGPPRLTTYLRYHCGLSKVRTEEGLNQAEILAIKREERRQQMLDRGQNWRKAKIILTKLANNASININCYLKEIEDVSRLIAPEPDTREEVSMMMFNLSYKNNVLPCSHRQKLKYVVGDVKNIMIDKGHLASRKISELLGDDEITDALESLQNDSQKPKIFGENIKVGPAGIRPDLPRGKLMNFKRVEKPEFSLKYVNTGKENKLNGVSANTKLNKLKEELKKDSYDICWMQTEMLKYYDDSGMIEELSNSTMALLNGSKSNAELENELIDLLGFDRFELIGILLCKREDIRKGAARTKLMELHSMDTEKRDVRPSYGHQVVVLSETEKSYLKLARKEDKKIAKGSSKNSTNGHFDQFNPEELRAKREAALLEASVCGAISKICRSSAKPLHYPYVFDSNLKAKQSAGFIAGNKMLLPDGMERTTDNIKEEVIIPITDPAPPNVGAKLFPISEFDPIGKVAFKNCTTLNRIQTVVHPVAYHTNENLLVCAPTGAGKTNIAMLTVVHQIRQHIEDDVIQKDKFKIVYIAPMKALAAEMARNFGSRLEPFGLQVKELTGDMHLTKPEIMATTMIITTPEKWDVTTRKPGDTQLAQLVKLLIIDEVHLLHGDRGPVLETLVARTLRMVESQQSMVRIVGLSATLPNYIDIAYFLHVNPYKGLFYFDGRFRPVPLGLSFIGIKAKPRLQMLDDMDRVTFDKCHKFVREGHQVMVFVHARNGTLRTAKKLIQLSEENHACQEFRPDSLSDVSMARKAVMKSRNKKLLELFDCGFGVHHAGLLRCDRSIMERLFSQGFIKVLVTTSTLAWGINLPAHAVIIKGTDIYDSKHGTFIDLGMLDVLQIFGRAGRPQFDKTGHGTIITTHEKLAHYLSLLTNQYPIESSFINYLADNMNAEISLGTITNVDEAVEWLSYTYLYVRMRKNPQAYGLKYGDAQYDPDLHNHRRDLIHIAAKNLDRAHMIRYDEQTQHLNITDLGRIASQFYIKFDTIEIFNEYLKQIMNETGILSLISRASEFTQLKIRDEEMDELDDLHHACRVAPMGGVENVHGKVNILLQSFISRIGIDGFSLVSDMSYVTENSVRIARALFEIVLHKGWPLLASRFLNMVKMLERRMWNFESPLNQFPNLSYEILEKIDARRLTVEKIRDMDYKEVGQIIRHEKKGRDVVQAAWQFPLLNLEVTSQPITRTVLRIKLDITADFSWNDRLHGKQEIYWIWVEDPINNHMYHHEEFKINKKQVVYHEKIQLTFTIPIFEPLPSQYYIRAISDRWLACESICSINFDSLILPELHPPHTPLLDLDPLPITALKNSSLEILYNFTHFNPIQTQLFHCLYHTDNNVLLGAPTGSGKTIAAEIAMFRVFKMYKDTKVVYIAPLKALVRERVSDWKERLSKSLKKNIVELTGDVTPDIRAIQDAHVIITTPEKWDGISRSWQTRNYVKKVSLIIIDEIHLLGEDRGPVLEVIVSRTNFISSFTNRKLRIVGLSTALANAVDLANWLGIGQMGLYNFRPSVRPVPLEVHISGFPGKHYCPRMATMNKPTFQAIKQHSPDKPTLVFVSSRRQTRLTALDLMSFVVTDPNPKQWLRMPEHEMEIILDSIKDENLRLCLSFGLGLHHAGLVDKDRRIVEELFVNQKIQILIATSTLAWGVNFPAHLVVVKGTEYFDGKTKRYVDFPITDVLQMMGRAGRPQYDEHGVAVILVHDQKKHFYKKFLYEPFPVESSLMNVLSDHLNAEIVAGTISTLQEALDYLTWTYFFRRLAQNPSYYGLQLSDRDKNNDINKFLSQIIENSVQELSESYCVEVEEDGRTIVATPLGRITSYYYLSHKTMRMFREKIHENITLEQLFYVMTQAEEYAELPVRHNEDNLNCELAKKCPIKVDEHTYDSSHTKTHLLLQAHMSRLQLPCVDYLTDLKSVLDQALRILQAMVDVCSCAGWLAASLQTNILMQMVVQGRWHTDSSILILPHISHDSLYCFKRNSGQLISCLPDLVHSVGNNYENFAKMLRNELTEGEIETAFNVLKSYPVINLSASVQGKWAADTDKTSVSLILSGSKEVVEVHAGEEYSIVCNLRKLNKNCRGKAYTPHFPKSKEESWFLILGESMHSGELLALKRVRGFKGKTSHSVSFTTPSEPGDTMLTIYLMSDCYLGFDQQFDIKLKIIPAMEPEPVCQMDEICVTVLNKETKKNEAFLSEKEEKEASMEEIEQKEPMSRKAKRKNNNTYH